MSIVLLVAYAALCVWFAVRIVNHREKRPKRMLAFIIAPCLYALSFGPMASLDRHGFIPDLLTALFLIFYAPLMLFLNDAPEPVSWLLNWIFNLWP